MTSPRLAERMFCFLREGLNREAAFFQRTPKKNPHNGPVHFVSHDYKRKFYSRGEHFPVTGLVYRFDCTATG